MSLRLLTPNGNPYGIFDGYDSEYLVLKGGEVVSFSTVSVSGSDLAAKDAFNDGYSNPSGVEKRVVVTKTLVSGMRPLMLADDRNRTVIGTTLGSVLGGVAGQVTTGVVIGPSTASGSGKVTCWASSGLYAVSLDACDTNASTGLQPTNTTLTTGAALYATTAGLLTPNSGAAFEAVIVGRFIGFETNSSLVTTSANMSQSLNSPGSSVAVPKTFTHAVFQFTPHV